MKTDSLKSSVELIDPPLAEPGHGFPEVRARFVTEAEAQSEAETRGMPGITADSIRDAAERRNIDPAIIVEPLRDVFAKEAELNKAQEELSAERRAALELQAEAEGMVARAKSLALEISDGEIQLAKSKAIVTSADETFDTWHSASANSIAGFQIVTNTAQSALQHKWIADRLGPWLDNRKAQLAALEKEIAAFSKANKISLK